MEQDDIQVGRLLSRREALALIGISGAAILTGCRYAKGATTEADAESRLPSCVVRPEQTEGPYFVDGVLNRRDIRSDPVDGAVKAGVPLELAVVVSQIKGRCTPLAGATVDLWHCDAAGVYSGVEDPDFDTVGKKFLRGYQVTDSRGMAQFKTIYPGWYPGRTVHIHFKIRTDPSSAQGHEFTSQLYFDDSLTNRVHALAPYAARGRRTVMNEDDGIFEDGGRQLMLAPTKKAPGYAATFDIGLEIA